MPRKYSDILRTLCNPSIFRTLVYSKLWHIQNIGIFRALGYSEPEANSESCQTSMMEHYAKILAAIAVFGNYNYFCNISFSRSLLFKI